MGKVKKGEEKFGSLYIYIYTFVFDYKIFGRIRLDDTYWRYEGIYVLIVFESRIGVSHRALKGLKWYSKAVWL